LKPVLFEVGPLSVHAYGLALAVAFLVGSLWVVRRARPLGYYEEHLTQLFWWILISALLGARFYYAFQHPDDYRDDWLGIFRLWQGGLTQYGGLIGAVIGAGIYIRARRWSFLEISDLVAPALALGEAITRVGCFFNGCCFGDTCDLPWAITYPPGGHAYLIHHGAGIHPSQLYLCVGNALLTLLLVRAAPHLARRGRSFALFLMGSATIRFLVDFTRYYGEGDTVTVGGLNLAHSQWASILFVAVAIALWARAPHRRASGPPPPPSPSPGA
jgi:phosphatidylglycerol:prolipoprotein diacylglycerol transferase